MNIAKKLDDVEKKNGDFHDHCKAFREVMQTVFWVFVVMIWRYSLLHNFCWRDRLSQLIFGHWNLWRKRIWNIINGINCFRIRLKVFRILLWEIMLWDLLSTFMAKINGICFLMENKPQKSSSLSRKLKKNLLRKVVLAHMKLKKSLRNLWRNSPRKKYQVRCALSWILRTKLFNLAQDKSKWWLASSSKIVKALISKLTPSSSR